MHKDIQDVWNYLTTQCGHARLWLKRNPIPPQHRVSSVMVRYKNQPVIVSGSGRALAVLNLTKGEWEYTGITPKCLPQDLDWTTPPSNQELKDDEMVQQLSQFTELGA
jgi:hypothetical protein